MRRWALDNAARRISEYILESQRRGIRRVCGVRLETRGVEPLRRSVRRVSIRIAKQNRSCRGIGVDDSAARRIEVRRDHRERQATVVSDNSRSLPTAEQLAHQIILLPEERQFVNVVDAQNVTPIESRTRVFRLRVVRILRSGRAIVLAVSQVLRESLSEIQLGRTRQSLLP